MLHNSQKDIIKRHIGPSKKDEKSMLEQIGYKSLDELIENTVPDKILLKDVPKSFSSITPERFDDSREAKQLETGDIVIAAITSCTNN